MSRGCARLNEICTGHGCFPSRNNLQGSPDTFINNRPSHRLGDMWASHCCPKQGCHPGSLSSASTTVFVNGKGQGRINDAVNCGSRVMTCSPDVFCDDDVEVVEANIESEIALAELIDEPEIDMGVLVWPHPTSPPSQGDIQKSKANGYNPYNPPPVPKQKDETPPIPIEQTPIQCDGLKAPFATTMKLTKNISLGMVSTNAIVSHYTVVAQHGLTEAQIICNLKKLSENILETLIDNSIEFKINSGFRTSQGLNESGKISQHELGKAVDLSFPGLSKPNGYYTMAQKLKNLVPFDQLILEYGNTTNSMWIHISYDTTPRRVVLTRLSSGNYVSGLATV